MELYLQLSQIRTVGEVADNLQLSGCTNVKVVNTQLVLKIKNWPSILLKLGDSLMEVIQFIKSHCSVWEWKI